MIDFAELDAHNFAQAETVCPVAKTEGFEAWNYSRPSAIIRCSATRRLLSNSDAALLDHLCFIFAKLGLIDSIPGGDADLHSDVLATVDDASVRFAPLQNLVAKLACATRKPMVFWRLVRLRPRAKRVHRVGHKNADA